MWKIEFYLKNNNLIVNWVLNLKLQKMNKYNLLVTKLIELFHELKQIIDVSTFTRYIDIAIKLF